MFIFIRIFLYFLVFYQFLSTIVWYGLGLDIWPWYIALSKDLVWIFFFIILILTHARIFKIYIQKSYLTIFSFIFFFIFWLFCTYRFVGFGSMSDYLHYLKSNVGPIVQWFRTIIYPIIIFWSAILVWIISSRQRKQILTRRFFLIFFSVIFVWGLVLQLSKHIFPDTFYHIWYAPVGDRIPNQKPPIYYRTWPWWLPRLSWFFAWPNNFGYLIILFTPILCLLFVSWNSSLGDWDSSPRDTKKLKYGFFSSRIFKWDGAALVFLVICWIRTLSRAVILAWMIELVIIFYRQILKHYKVFLPIILIAILWFVWLSIYKSWSSSLHLSLRNDWLRSFWSSPLLWHGIWYSGPPAHYNGNIIPENFYLQILIDAGILWFAIRILTIVSSFIFVQKNLSDGISSEVHSSDTGLEFSSSHIIRFYIIWLISRFVIGMFLHIREDNTINYIFFIIFGITIWQHIILEKKIK